MSGMLIERNRFLTTLFADAMFSLSRARGRPVRSSELHDIDGGNQPILYCDEKVNTQVCRIFLVTRTRN